MTMIDTEAMPRFGGEVYNDNTPTPLADGAGSDDGIDIPLAALGGFDGEFYNSKEEALIQQEIDAAEAAMQRDRGIDKRFGTFLGITSLQEVVVPEPVKASPLRLSPQLLGVEGSHIYN